MQAPVQGSGDDLKMRIIRCEDRTDISRLGKLVQGIQIGFGVDRLILLHVMCIEKS